MPATNRALDRATLREQFGRLGETPFALADARRPRPRRRSLPARARAQSPAPERCRAADALAATGRSRRSTPSASKQIERAVFDVDGAERASAARPRFSLSAQVLSSRRCRQTPRTPARPRSRSIRSCDILRRRWRAFARSAESLGARGVALRLRTPTIVRPEDRRGIAKWLDTGLAAPQRTPRSGGGTRARRTRRRRRLRRQRHESAQRRAALPARRASSRLIRRADRGRDERRRRAVARSGIRRVPVRPARRNDDRALRAIGRVRSRTDHLPRSVRPEARERHAHGSCRLRLRRRHRLGVSQSPASLASGRRLGVPRTPLERGHSRISVGVQRSRRAVAQIVGAYRRMLDRLAAGERLGQERNRRRSRRACTAPSRAVTSLEPYDRAVFRCASAS